MLTETTTAQCDHCSMKLDMPNVAQRYHWLLDRGWQTEFVDSETKLKCPGCVAAAKLATRPVVTRDLVYSITTDGRGRLFLEDEGGTELAASPAGRVDDDTFESFAKVIVELLRNAEFA